MRRVGAAAMMAAGLALALPAVAVKGPSSSATPYLAPIAPGVEFTAILTVGDAAGTKSGAARYVMAGVPDGLGAFDNRDGTFTVLMNHELAKDTGAVRAHGARGAFVSKWVIRKRDLAVISGEDLIRRVRLWDNADGRFVDSPGATLARFCSADLPRASALYNAKTGLGYRGRIFLNGEELWFEGRAFAHVVTGADAGTSYALPSLGKASWENAVASPHAQDKTVVILLDDASPGEIYVYVGRKQREGSPIEMAGLHGGRLFGVKVKDTRDEDRITGVKSNEFALHSFGDVRDMGGKQLDAAAVAGGVTRFLRPEDGAWDTRDRNAFYFTTTDRYDEVKDGVGTQIGRSRLWRLTFSDIEQPERGGRIDALLDGTGPTQMLDNLAVDDGGGLVLLEDPDDARRSARIWTYEPRSRQLTLIARHDPARFGDLDVAPTPPFNTSEESSGIIEITRLFDDVAGYETGKFRYFLLDVQAHYALPGDLVGGGQLLLMKLPRIGRREDDAQQDR